jgi:hypothetical protein
VRQAADDSIALLADGDILSRNRSLLTDNEKLCKIRFWFLAKRNSCM